MGIFLFRILVNSSLAHFMCFRLISLCQRNSRGISEEVILAEMPALKGQPLADAINRLMKKVKTAMQFKVFLCNQMVTCSIFMCFICAMCCYFKHLIVEELT